MMDFSVSKTLPTSMATWASFIPVGQLAQVVCRRADADDGLHQQLALDGVSMFSATATISSGRSSRVSSPMTTISVSLTDRTKSLCLRPGRGSG